MTADAIDPVVVPAVATLDYKYSGDLALGRRGLRPSHPRVSVIAPAKDEAENIREILPYLNGFFEVIVVVSEDDQKSVDAAVAALPSARIVYQQCPGVRVR